MLRIHAPLDQGPSTKPCRETAAVLAVAVLGKIFGEGAWPLIIWEETTAKRNYYRTS